MESFVLSISAHVQAVLKTYAGCSEESLTQAIYEALPSSFDPLQMPMFHVRVQHLGQTDLEDGEYKDEWLLILSVWGQKAGTQHFSPSYKRQLENQTVQGIYPNLTNVLKEALTFLPYFFEFYPKESQTFPDVKVVG